MSAVDLHGNLRKSKFGGYLFVHEAGRYQSQNLPLAGGQGLEKRSQIRDYLVGFPTLPIPIDRRHHSVQHVLVTKRFGQEIDRAALHGPDGHRNVAVASHEDDWNMDIRPGQLGLEIQTAQPWQPDIEHQAAGALRKLVLQHFGRGAEYRLTKYHLLKK